MWFSIPVYSPNYPEAFLLSSFFFTLFFLNCFGTSHRGEDILNVGEIKRRVISWAIFYSYSLFWPVFLLMLCGIGAWKASRSPGVWLLSVLEGDKS